MHEVAVTGIGIVSVLGTGVDKVAAGLKQGKSGVVFDQSRLDIGFRSGLTGVISDFEVPSLSRKQRKTMTEFTLWAYGAAKEALAMSGLNDDDIHSQRTGLIIGNDTTTLANIEQVDITRDNNSTFSIGSTRVFQALNSTTTMNLNTLLGNRGAAWTLSGACASGGHAVGQARDLIALGRQDQIICGGVQEINWQSVSSFDATNAFSTLHKNPTGASRPFDNARDGLVPSGGAAILVLERLDLAQKRGAVILGKISSYGFSSDGSNLAVPSGDGLQTCIEDCLQLGQTNANEIDYICAHGTSTPVGDAKEAQAIYNVFGSDGPWVSSVKSMTGHEMWMSGASQVVYSLLMARDGFIAQNLNFEKQESEAPKLKIATEVIDKKAHKILTNSAGFGGTNSCLLLEVE